VPLVLDGGLPAVVWGDNITGGDGRLHLATEGASEAPQAAFPRVRVGAPQDSSLRVTQSLVLPVSCAAACDVRAKVNGKTAQVSLLAAGRGKLIFDRFFFFGRSARSGRVAVTVTSGPPGAHAVQRQVVRPRLRLVPEPPLPRILDLVARRSGSDVDVTWRTDRSAPDLLYWVQSSVHRDQEDSMPSDGVRQRGRSFHVRLRKVPTRAAWVRVMAGTETQTRRASVRIK
jgi:hypothetical protein